MHKIIAANRIAFFGGSFNQPHLAHVFVSNLALKKLKLDQVFWLVVPFNPFKKGRQTLNQQKRIDLCNNLINHPKIKAIDFESKLSSGFETYNTIKKLRSLFTEKELFWIMGTDNLEHFNKWKRSDYIANNIKLVVFARGNVHKFVRTSSFIRFKPTLIWSKKYDISSTQIRKNLGENWMNDFTN